jgi:hypothetical protein
MRGRSFPSSSATSAQQIFVASERLPLDALGRLDPHALQIAATASRSMVGFLTQAAFETRHYIEQAGGLHCTDVDELNRWLRRALRNRDGYHDALELVTRRQRRRSGHSWRAPARPATPSASGPSSPPDAGLASGR